MQTELVVHLFGLTDAGTRRQTNEDAWAAGELGGACLRGAPPAGTIRVPSAGAPVFAVVCDGVGGANAGEIASELAVQCIQKDLTRRLAGGGVGRPVEAIRRALEASNQAVLE